MTDETRTRRFPLPAALAALALLTLHLAAGPAPAAAQPSPCGDPGDFNGAYSLTCSGRPTLTLHAALTVRGQTRTLQRDLPLACDGAGDPGFAAQLEEFRRRVEELCRSLGGADCERASRDLAGALVGVNDALVRGLDQRMEVNVWWNHLFFHHRLQAQESYRGGGSQQVNYTINNGCGGQRGKFVTLGFALGNLGPGSACLPTLVATAEGRIDPARFTIRKQVAIDGSLTCAGNGLLINVGVTFRGETRGERR